ncbi:nucleotide-diphospho-sugar transferase [Chryseolinea sp. H1M3-3]|uniref:nucleotide-diphospho-sugar transferase n=1 Tax=Chryseolinea sp. H1M3-3 TaxID=3034144 RepID=UPI0023ED0FC2|nr:nucleotide-diphospho-sugar transferase [Chryseolinea sp. H1M3-3]
MTPVLTQNLNTPVLFLIFNRPAQTQQVFNAIREARPKKLYIAADGPRPSKKGELENCLSARNIALDVDWECEVKTMFRDENLGCGKGVSTAITWFFEHEPEGIILEDDCLPSPDFFPFCSELLERYRDDKRIMGIGGSNLVPENFRPNDYSYFFSNHNNIWGWASWRRAWNLYDYEMSEYKKIKKLGYLKNHFASPYEFDYFQWVFERTFLFPSITWDYQWEFVRRINSGLTILPHKNLISNLGFGEDATHTTNPVDKSSKLKLERLDFPLSHPEYIIVDHEADKMAFIEHYTNLTSRLKTTVKTLLPPSIRTKLFNKSMERFIQSQLPQEELEKDYNHNSLHRKRLEEYSTPNYR